MHNDGMGWEGFGKAENDALNKEPSASTSVASDPPSGVPRYIMRTLANEGLSSDPQAYNLRLQQLLSLHELSKNGG
jgi:hypothetical protein